MSTLLKSAVNPTARNFISSVNATAKNLTDWANDLSRQIREAKDLYPLIQNHLKGHADEWENFDGLCVWLIDACMKPQIKEATRDMAHKSIYLSFEIKVSDYEVTFDSDSNPDSDSEVYNFEDALWRQKVTSKKALTLSLGYAVKNYLKQYAVFYKENLGIPASTTIACSCTYSSPTELTVEYFENRESQTDFVPLEEFQNDYDSLIKELSAESLELKVNAKSFGPEDMRRAELNKVYEKKDNLSNGILARTIASKDAEYRARIPEVNEKTRALEETRKEIDELDKYREKKLTVTPAQAGYKVEKIFTIIGWVLGIGLLVLFVAATISIMITDSVGTGILAIVISLIGCGLVLGVFKLLSIVFGRIASSAKSIKYRKYTSKNNALNESLRKTASELDKIRASYDNSYEKRQLESQMKQLDNEEKAINQEYDNLNRALVSVEKAL